MAATEQKINFAVMYATHDAFRRDLDRFVRAGERGVTDAPQVRAGWQNFKQQLLVHHSVEDAVLWPRVEAAVVGRPDALTLMTAMEEEHARLEPLLEQVDAAMEHQSSNLGEHVRQLAVVLGEHMKHEENSALPLIQEVLTVKDWAAFRTAMARRQGPRGAATYIPWIMDGVGPDDRRRFLDEMPGPVGLVNRLFLESRYRRRALWQA
jgi:iron-sulfur cluster repair protein YtfE (RIC family)